MLHIRNMSKLTYRKTVTRDGKKMKMKTIALDKNCQNKQNGRGHINNNSETDKHYYNQSTLDLIMKDWLGDDR
jgi:hypothetical protein